MLTTYDKAGKMTDQELFFILNESILKSMNPEHINLTREIVFKALRDAKVQPILGNSAMFTILVDGFIALKKDFESKQKPTLVTTEEKKDE